MDVPPSLLAELRWLPEGCGLPWLRGSLRLPAFVLTIREGIALSHQAIHMFPICHHVYPQAGEILECRFELWAAKALTLDGALLLNPGDQDQRKLLQQLTEAGAIELVACTMTAQDTFQYAGQRQVPWPEMHRRKLRDFMAQPLAPATRWHTAVELWTRDTNRPLRMSRPGDAFLRSTTQSPPSPRPSAPPVRVIDRVEVSRQPLSVTDPPSLMNCVHFRRSRALRGEKGNKAPHSA